MVLKEKCVRLGCETRASKHVIMGSHKLPLCEECAYDVETALRFHDKFARRVTHERKKLGR